MASQKPTHNMKMQFLDAVLKLQKRSGHHGRVIVTQRPTTSRTGGVHATHTGVWSATKTCLGRKGRKLHITLSSMENSNHVEELCDRGKISEEHIRSM